MLRFVGHARKTSRPCGPLAINKKDYKKNTKARCWRGLAPKNAKITLPNVKATRSSFSVRHCWFYVHFVVYFASFLEIDMRFRLQSANIKPCLLRYVGLSSPASNRIISDPKLRLTSLNLAFFTENYWFRATYQGKLIWVIL